MGTMGTHVLWEARDSVKYTTKPGLMDGEEDHKNI